MTLQPFQMEQRYYLLDANSNRAWSYEHLLDNMPRTRSKDNSGLSKTGSQRLRVCGRGQTQHTESRKTHTPKRPEHIYHQFTKWPDREKLPHVRLAKLGQANGKHQPDILHVHMLTEIMCSSPHGHRPPGTAHAIVGPPRFRDFQEHSVVS